MIKFYTEFSGNEKLNYMIKSFISQRLLKLTETIGNKCRNTELLDDVKDLFPQDFSATSIPIVIKDLCELLEKPTEETPDLLMEYFLKRLLDKAAEYNFDIREPFVEQEFAKITFGAEAETSNFDKERYIQIMLDGIEDLTHYENFIFCDTDYEMLDEFSVEQLKKVSKTLGIDISVYLEEKQVV